VGRTRDGEAPLLMEAAAILRGLPAQRRAAAFERDCERLRPLGEAYLMRRFGSSLNRADAEDAVAEVVIRLHRQVAAGNPPRNLRATFFTSVRNAAIDVLRSRAAKPTVALEAVAEAPALSPSPAECAESREDTVRLAEALARMRGNYREAIVLRFGLGLSVPEIAGHLGVSLPAAKKLLLRATRQVRMRLEAIEGQEFCPEMRELARCSLFEKEASGLASEAEARALNAHFEHCGSCRSFLTALHENLHEFGGAALLGVAEVTHLGAAAAGLDRLGRWLGAAAHTAQGAVAKLRFAAFKATGALQPGDAGSAGALAGTGQKIAAVCTAGVATTATCLATGIVGPGIGISAPPPAAHHSPPAKVKTISEPIIQAPTAPSAPSVPESKPAVAPEPSSSSSKASEPSSTPPPSQTPTQEGQAEFGIEHSSPPASESAPAPEASTAGSSSASSGGGSSSGAAKGGTESFGFHG
jgi:RNA polymerase sigma factor (sigma-70 family)